MCKETFKKIGVTILLLCLILGDTKAFTLIADDFSNNSIIADEVLEIMDCIENPEPILSINVNGTEALFRYDLNYNRIEKRYGGKVVNYIYEADRLMSEVREDICLQYLYQENEELCYGFICN